ncbi:TetR/AcrR family transcriptional regulator [Mycolicibacterium sp. P9-64]|nr:TetR/AcrR family transcriptional regulator [Mycolicibacterium sp. P9-64]
MLKNSTCSKVTTVTATSPPRSGRGRRSKRPSGDEREAAILATAERLLEDKKFADISVDDLAKGAGLSRPTFYFYFPSKEAVLLSLLEPLIAQADKGFDGAIESLPADPRRAFREGIRIFFTAFGSHSVVARAGTEALATSPDIRTMWSEFMQKWINQTAALIEYERGRGAAPENIGALDLATSLNQMNERAMTATLIAEHGAVAQDRLVDTLAHIWLTSIYGASQ